jgi:hypothetical protein
MLLMVNAQLPKEQLNLAIGLWGIQLIFRGNLNQKRRSEKRLVVFVFQQPNQAATQSSQMGQAVAEDRFG